MTECQNEAMRDQLPLLAHGERSTSELSASDIVALRAHVASCADCASELALLERSARLFAQATPRIDTAAILAKLPAAPGTRPTLKVVRGATPKLGVPRYALAAAATMVLVATLSLAALRDNFGNTTPSTDIGPDTSAPVVASVPVGIVGGNELGDLGVDDLETLLQELDQLEATIAAEPITMQRPVTDAPEGL
jgi:hypothetical protein